MSLSSCCMESHTVAGVSHLSTVSLSCSFVPSLMDWSVERSDMTWSGDVVTGRRRRSSGVPGRGT